MSEIIRPSSFFEDVVMDGGTTTATCGFCGRFHFATHSEECLYEEGEVERLRKCAEEKPDRYVEHAEDDSLGIGEINGVTAVIGCPCDGLAKLEMLIWNNRGKIARYFKARSEAALKAAEREAGALLI